MSKSTPRPYAPVAAGPSGAAIPLAQCVTMSPGRSRSSTSATGGGASPTCAITGTPHASATAMPRRSGSTPLAPTVAASMRTLMPRIRSRFARTVRTARSTSSGSRSTLSPVRAASPGAAMFSSTGTRTDRVAAYARSPSMVNAPADPASTHVVTPVYQAIGSGSTPQ